MAGAASALLMQASPDKLGRVGCYGLLPGEPKGNLSSPQLVRGAFCLDVRTLTFCQLLGFPVNH